MCLLNYVLNCEQNLSYFDPDNPMSRLPVTGLAGAYCTSNIPAHKVITITCNVPSCGRQGDVVQLHRAELLLTRMTCILGSCRLLHVVL
jgi:hypothetical protein